MKVLDIISCQEAERRGKQRDRISPKVLEAGQMSVEGWRVQEA